MNELKFKTLSENCQICDGELEIAIDLPKLPLTGIYSQLNDETKINDFDQ